MPSNLLKGTVEITAPGVAGTFDKVAEATRRGGRSLQTLSNSSNQATFALTNLGRVAQDVPFGFLGIANNLNPLLESFQRLKASTGSTGGALKALGNSLMGAGGLGFALSLASAAMLIFSNGFQSFSRKASAAKASADEFKDSLKGITQAVVAEIGQVEVLIAFIQKETTSRQQRTNAIKELQQIAPEYFATLNAEKATILELTTAYNSFAGSISNSIKGRVLSKELEKIITERLRLENMIGGSNREQVVINGKLVTGQKAFYGTAQDVLAIQDKINNAKLQELKISQLIATLQPPKGVFKVDAVKSVPSIKIKPDKVIFDLLNSKVPLADIEFPDAFGGLLHDWATRSVNIFQKEIQAATAARSFMTEQEYEEYMNLDAMARAILAANERIFAAAKSLAETFKSAIQTGFEDAFSAVGEGIGNILGGKDFGTQLFQVFGSLLDQIGKALIKFGIVKTGLDAILKNPLIPGGFAIALGVFSIAAGQLLKNIKGARALGGPVLAGSSYLVGERGPELFTPNTGGNIVANNQLGGRGVGAGGGLSITGTIQNILRGQDLLQLITIANQSKGRLQ